MALARWGRVLARAPDCVLPAGSQHAGCTHLVPWLLGLWVSARLWSLGP